MIFLKIFYIWYKILNQITILKKIQDLWLIENKYHDFKKYKRKIVEEKENKDDGKGKKIGEEEKKENEDEEKPKTIF